MKQIHPTALVDSKADIADGVHIGAYSVVGPHVRVGRNTTIASHVVLDGHLKIGQDCRIYSNACLGTPAQSRKLPARSYTKIGDNNTIREFVTVNSAMNEEASTVIGSRNFIMIGAHIAHDCQVGNDITLANSVALGGHVIVEDSVVIGGLSGVHQFVRIGRNAMIGGLSKIVMDVPPYAMCDGNPAALYSINAIGLKRAGFSAADMRKIRGVLKHLLGSGKKLSSAMEKTASAYAGDPQIQNILHFIQTSKRGLLRFSRTVYDE